MKKELGIPEEQVSIAVTFDRFSRFLLGELDNEYADLTGALYDAETIMRYIQDEMPKLVEGARQQDVSWQQIGDVLGISRQAAHQRFGK